MIMFNCLPRSELESFCGLSFGLQEAEGQHVLLNYAEYVGTDSISDPGPWQLNPNKQKGGRKARQNHEPDLSRPISR